MDKNIRESLVGRASYHDLNTLSVAEILSSCDVRVQDILYQGGWPELYAHPEIPIKKYLDDYISTYI